MGSRADRWLREKFPSLTRRQGEEALEAGLARHFSGRKAHKGDKVESLDCRGLEEHLARLRTGTAGLSISVVKQADGWVAVDKPPGVDGHPISLFDDKTLTHWAFAKWPDLRVEFPVIQPTVVPHRLDRDTSGLQIVALTRDAYAEWRRRFQSGEVTKRYHAWVWGEPREKSWSADWPLAHDPSDARKMVAAGPKVRHRPPVLSARTDFEVLEKRGGMVLLEAVCRTGVTHQVRVHAAQSGLPLVGDALYDREIERRGVKSPGHWLRAVELSWSSEALKLEPGIFEKGPGL